MGGGCFLQGTQISTPEGRKPIEQIKEGDRVICFDKYSRICESYVTGVDYHPPKSTEDKKLKVTHELGELFVTDNHYILAKDDDVLTKQDAFKEMADFKVGEYLTTEAGIKVKILKIEEIEDKVPVYTFNVAVYPTYIADGIRVHNGGGKKGSSTTTVTYHWGFAITEIICYEKPLIKFEATLGNVILLGDGSTTTAQIPNYWMRKYFHKQGYGYLKLYPYEVRLWRNSKQNELLEGTDFSYDYETGLIQFHFTPSQGDIIAGTWTYDPEHAKETTFYADFSYNSIWQRVGYKYYKQQDEGLDTYLKCALRAKHLLSELYKPIIHGSYDIVYNPKIEIGQSIYINHIIPNVQRVFFIDSVRESHGKDTHTVEIGGLSFPEFTGGLAEYKEHEGVNRFDLYIPTDIITFKGNTYRDDGMYISGTVKRFDTDTLDENFTTNLQMELSKRDETIIFPILGHAFSPNERYIRSFEGQFYQFYDISFQTGTYDEFTDPDVFFAQRTSFFKVFHSFNPYETKTISQVIYVGRKELLGNHNPGYYASGDHLLFTDVDGGVWMVDYRFTSKKIGQIPSGTPLTNLNWISSYQYAFLLVGSSLRRIDVDDGTWTTIGSITHDHHAKYYPKGYYVDPNAELHIYMTGKYTPNAGLFDNEIWSVKYKDGAITESKIVDETGSSYPISGNLEVGLGTGWVYGGIKAWDINTGIQKTGLSSLESGDPSVFYKFDGYSSAIWATVCYDNANGLQSTVGKSKTWSFYRRVDNSTDAWDKKGTVTFTDDMVIIPVGVDFQGNLIIYMKGDDLKQILHPQVDSAIAIVNWTYANAIQIKTAKVGEDISIYNRHFYIGSKPYINWKWYDFNLFPILAEISL